MALLKEYSRDLRRNPTEAEKKLWQHLRRRQFHSLKFRRQFPIDRYIADFVCWEKKLVIELDGGQHADNENDKERTKALEACGFLVLRFWNNDVLTNMEGILHEIENTLKLPPHRGRAGWGVTVMK